jgi:hypothetical protein
VVRARFDGQYFVQNCLNPPERTAAATVALVVQSNAPSVWTCPNRPGLPVYESGYNQWVIGYQYFGGVTNWYNPAGTFPFPPSPVKLASAKPHWVLAADPVMKVNGKWGGLESGREFVYKDMPQHRGSASMVPAGGNEVFVDSSVQWVKFQTMFFLHSWNLTTRIAYFYQDPKDFPQGLRNSLPTLRAQP